MKITLKRVLICGMSLLAVLLLMIAMLLPIKVWNTPGSIGERVLCTGSIWGAISQNVFSEGYAAVRLADAAAGSGSGSIQAAVEGDNALAKTMGIITLVVFFVNILAIAGAFFLKTNKGARKLIIPVFIISAIFFFVATIICTAGLSYSTSVAGQPTTIVAPDDSLGVVIVMIGAAIVVFIAMLIVSGVVKEKTLATLGKK